MTTPTPRLTFAERLNFLLTNRLPRRWLTLFMGRFSKVENPLVRSASIAVWRTFADDLRLHEAEKRHFSSMHDCFTRRLRDGARAIDPRPEVLASPCDAVIGEFGDLAGVQAIQAKGFPYGIDELLGADELVKRYRSGKFITLRLKSSMYHRFHAPCDGRIGPLTYISGDTWNVNPIALKRIERLFCKNERVVIPVNAASGAQVVLVVVAAILVASVRVHGLEDALNLRYAGPNRVPFERDVSKGQELGYFEHGSTIVLLAPAGLTFDPALETGQIIRMGSALLHDETEAHS